MNRIVALVVCVFGLLVGLLASGNLSAEREVLLRTPGLNPAFLFPVVSFALLALALAARPRYLNNQVVVVATVLLALSCAYLLLPTLHTSTSTDGQSGMFEALVGMATLPATAVALGVAALVARVGTKFTTKDDA